jgi:hypothetical protein
MSVSMTDIQQAFVRRYMDGSGVVGVSVEEIGDQLVLLVEVGDPKAVELPETFQGLPVKVVAGRPAILAYS